MRKRNTARNALALACLGLTAACASSRPTADLLFGSEPLAARRGLAQAAQAGPVPVVIAGPEAPPSQAVLDALDEGISGLGVELQPKEAPIGPHVVALFGTGVTGVCGGQTPAPQPGGVAVGFCDGGLLLAGAAAEQQALDDEARLRALRRATRLTFPDDYERGYGLGGLGVGVNIFGGSRSGVGVGVGVGF